MPQNPSPTSAARARCCHRCRRRRQAPAAVALRPDRDPVGRFPPTCTDEYGGWCGGKYEDGDRSSSMVGTLLMEHRSHTLFIHTYTFYTYTFSNDNIIASLEKHTAMVQQATSDTTTPTSDTRTSTSDTTNSVNGLTSAKHDGWGCEPLRDPGSLPRHLHPLAMVPHPEHCRGLPPPPDGRALRCRPTWTPGQRRRPPGRADAAAGTGGQGCGPCQVTTEGQRGASPPRGHGPLHLERVEK